MTKDSEHLQWLHSRLVNVHGENENYDYMIRLREIIAKLRKDETQYVLVSLDKVDKDAESSRLNAESLRRRVPPITP